MTQADLCKTNQYGDLSHLFKGNRSKSEQTLSHHFKEKKKIILSHWFKEKQKRKERNPSGRAALQITHHAHASLVDRNQHIKNREFFFLVKFRYLGLKENHSWLLCLGEMKREERMGQRRKFDKKQRIVTSGCEYFQRRIILTGNIAQEKFVPIMLVGFKIIQGQVNPSKYEPPLLIQRCHMEPLCGTNQRN